MASSIALISKRKSCASPAIESPREGLLYEGALMGLPSKPGIDCSVLCLDAIMATANNAPASLPKASPLIEWRYYPSFKKAPTMAKSVVDAFASEVEKIASDSHDLPSNEVLEAIRERLQGIGFEVESGKHKDEKVCVPVLFGRGGAVEKSFDADAYHRVGGFVLEVEAGRGAVNHQFLKDLFQACMMYEVSYLAIAIRRVYKGARDFETVCRFFDTL